MATTSGPTSRKPTPTPPGSYRRNDQATVAAATRAVTSAQSAIRNRQVKR
jgi:hypothetical protein